MEKTYQEIIFAFNDRTSHMEVLENIIKKLVKAKFASRKEIKEEWETILKAKLLK